jgi:hypothetical protein
MEHKRDGSSIQQNASENARAPLGQRDLATQHGAVEPVGQPTKDYEGWEFCNIRIGSALAKYLRSLGGDDISEGVRIAAEFHQARVKDAG